MESSSIRYRVFRQGYNILQHLCVTLITLPPTVIIFGSFAVVRQIVSTFLHYSHNGRLQLLHPVDAVYSYDSTGSARFTFCLMVRPKNSQFSLDSLRQKIYDNPDFRFGPYKKLQYRLCTRFGFLCWEDMSIDNQFDINEHIKIFPGVGNKPLTESKLIRLLNKCANFKAPSTASQHPDWEILIVPQVRMKQEYSTQNDTVAALILSINHGYMDGNSTLEFLKACVMDQDEAIRLPSDYLIAKENNPQLFSRKLKLICRLLFYGPMYVYRAILCNSDSICLSPNNPCNTEESVMVARSNYSMTSVTMNKIRMVYGISSRTVIISAFVSALRIVAERKWIKSPNSLKVAFTHAKMPSSKRQPENRFALILKCLPLSELSPHFLKKIESLTKVNEDNQHEVDVSFFLVFLLGLQPVKLLRLGLKHLRPFTLGVTGSSAGETLYRIQGGLVEAFTAIPPLFDGIEYFCSFHNYGGKFTVSFCARTTNVIENSTGLKDFVTVFDCCLQALGDKANNASDAKQARAIKNDIDNHNI